MPDPVPPATTREPSDGAVRYNARLGLALFAVYLAVYAAFVAINAFWPAVMDRVVWSGLNVAVLFGLGLIIGAFLLALVYAGFCKSTREAGRDA